MNILNALKGIGGDFEIQRVVGAAGSDMSPSNAAFYFSYRGLRHSVPRGDSTLRTRRGADLDNHIGGQLACARALASAVCPMGHLILLILGLRGPSQIAKAIVRSASISMCRFMNWGWRIAEKGNGDNPVKIVVFGSSRDRQPDAMIVSQPATYPWFQDVPHRKARLLAHCGQDPLHAPLGARCIVRRERYRLPNLSAIVGLSHGAVPRIVGQGRALLKQRFRPVFYGRFTVRSQAKGVFA